MGKKRKKKLSHDKHHLYELSVQSVDADLDFAEKVYRKMRGRELNVLREDFSGTAVLACAWITRGSDRRAIAVDLDRPTLNWGIDHNVAMLGKDAKRLELICQDVRKVTRQKVEVTMALNFSYWVFTTRADMVEYFRAAHAGLREDGLFILDLFGGTEAPVVSEEEREIEADTTFDGTNLPKFCYYWDQESFNPITSEFKTNIHFSLKNGKGKVKAFSYDWRYWTLPELRELLFEAGFRKIDVYTDDWDDEADDSNGIYKRRKDFDNDGVWVGYIVAAV